MKKTFIGLCLLSFALTEANAQTNATTPNKQAPVKVTQTTTATKQTTPTQTPTTTTTTKQTAPTKTTTPTTTKTETNAPDVVKAKFASQYPGVKGAKWTMNKEGNYVAEFKANEKGLRVVYKADGSLVRTWKEVDESTLPQAAKDYISKNFAGQKITEVATMQGVNSGSVTYDVKVGDKKLKFDAKGNLATDEKPKTTEPKTAPKTDGKTAPKTTAK